MSSSEGSTARIEASWRPSAATAARTADGHRRRSLPGATAASRGRRAAGRRRATSTPGTHVGDRPGVAVVGAFGQVERDLDWGRASPNRSASSSIVPWPISRPEAKMPIRSHTRLDLVEQVARQEDRHPALADEPAQQVEDLDDAERVDRGRRLVEDQDVGILDEGIGDAEPLEHAPRVRVDRVVGARQADLVEDLVDRLLRQLRGIRLSRAV